MYIKFRWVDDSNERAYNFVVNIISKKTRLLRPNALRDDTAMAVATATLFRLSCTVRDDNNDDDDDDDP